MKVDGGHDRPFGDRREISSPPVQRALEAYRRRKVSLGRASQMAGMPISALLDELEKAGTPRDYDLEALKQDVAWAKRS